MDQPIVSNRQIRRLNPNQALRLWFAAGYLYEHEQESLIPDEVWDYLCKHLLEVWKKIDDPMRALIDRKALRTGTAGYLRRIDYPPRARGLAQRLLWEWHEEAVPYRRLVWGEWADIAGVPANMRTAADRKKAEERKAKKPVKSKPVKGKRRNHGDLFA